MLCGVWGWRMSMVYGRKAAYHIVEERNARLALQTMQTAPPSTTQIHLRDSARIMSAMVSLPGSKDLLSVSGRPPIAEPSPTAVQLARREAAKWENLVTYHLRMRRKYEWAASFPWLSVSPDPPEPK
jgi:hypothetical protein